MRNGQNVLVYAPRRYGKSSLVMRAAQEAQRRRVLIGYCDLLRTPTKEKFAAALAKTIYAYIASPAGHALERAANPSAAELPVGHVYLGSRRHVLEDLQRPRRTVLAQREADEGNIIPPTEFASFIETCSAEASREISDEALARLRVASPRHSYATQELAYFVWEAASGRVNR